MITTTASSHKSCDSKHCRVLARTLQASSSGSVLALYLFTCRLRAVPLRSVTSKFGRAGERKLTERRTGEREAPSPQLPLGFRSLRTRAFLARVNSLSPVLPSLDVTDRRGTARSLVYMMPAKNALLVRLSPEQVHSGCCTGAKISCKHTLR